MANDISKFQPRVARQGRSTNGRDGVLPSRRQTNAPDRQLFADIRSARRGDGGADAIRRALGLASASLTDAQDLAQVVQAKHDEKDATQAALDVQAGITDPVMMEKSRAYERSVELARTQRDWLTSSLELTDEVQAVVMENDDPNPTARKAAVAATIDKHFAKFAMGEDGHPKSFGSPAAQKWLSQQMAETRATVTQSAYAFIDKKVDEENVVTVSDVARASIRNGQPKSFEELDALLLPTVDRRAAKAAFLTVAKDEASRMAAEAQRLYSDNPEGAKALERQAVAVLNDMLRTLGPLETPAAQPSNPLEGTAAAPAAAAPRMTPAGNAGVIAGELRTAGMSDAVIAGFLGNFHHESAMGANKTPGDSGTAFGLAQWRHERVANFQRVIGKHPRNASLAEQAQFVAWEMKHPESAGMTTAQRDKILQAKSAAQAAHLIDKFYERSNGKSRKAREATASEFYANGGSADGGFQQGPAADPAVIDPQKPSERLTDVPLDAPQDTMAAYRLTPEEHYDLSEFKRKLISGLDRAASDARDENQTNTASDFLLRLHGVGAPTTIAEVQEAARTGKISPQNMVTLLNIIDRDNDELEIDARQAREEMGRADREAREATVKDKVNSVLGPLARGAMTPAEARKSVLSIAKDIYDPEVREAFVNSAHSGIEKTADLRTKTPEVQRAFHTFDEWQKEYIGGLVNAQVPYGKRKEAEARIKSWVEEWVVELGLGNVSPEAVDAYMKKAEERLDAKVLRAYPPRRLH